MHAQKLVIFLAFYNNLLELCEKNHVKPSVVAEAIGLTKSSATYWKRGSIPKLETIKKIADYFRVPISYFFDIPDDEIEFSETVLSKMAEYTKAQAVRIDSGAEGEEVELHIDLTGGKVFETARRELRRLCSELNHIGVLKATSYIEGLLENPLYQRKTHNGKKTETMVLDSSPEHDSQNKK